MRKAYRQGDVVIKVNGTIPDGAKKLDHLILAHGEVTGHKHQVIEGDCDLYEKDNKLWLSVQSETAVVGHEEHRAVTLEKGIFEIEIQKEYTPEGWTRVVD